MTNLPDYHKGKLVVRWEDSEGDPIKDIETTVKAVRSKEPMDSFTDYFGALYERLLQHKPYPFLAEPTKHTLHETTTVYRFERPNGDILQTPEPDPAAGWELSNEKDYGDFHRDHYDDVIPQSPIHESGKIWWHDMHSIMRDENARILWSAEYRRTVNTKEPEPPKEQITYDKPWPTGHSMGPIKRKK